LSEVEWFRLQTSPTPPSQSHLGRVRRYLHVGECTIALRMVAVQYATLRNCYGRYRFCTYGTECQWRHGVSYL